MAKEENLGDAYDIQRAENAWKNAGDINEYADKAYNQYAKGLGNLETMAEDVTDYYAPLTANTIDPKKLMMAEVAMAGGERGVDATVRDRMGNVNLMGTDNLGYTAGGYTAGQTNMAGLARGAGTGLSNVFNNLQVSTAGAQMQAAQTDQALANSLGLASQAGTGAGGATALAAAAAQSKAGIAAGIDQQVKQNELLRAQGEQGLQRDLLAQGNLASQFGLGQQQFNIGQSNQAAQFGASARNQAAQFEASARNQANQFNAQSQNQWQLQGAQMANAMDQFNISNQNAAFNNYAANVNSSIAQNASMQNQFDMNKAAGQTQAQANQWDAAIGLQDIYTGEHIQAMTDSRENQGLIDHGKALSAVTGEDSFLTNDNATPGGGTIGQGEIINPDWDHTLMQETDIYDIGQYGSGTPKSSYDNVRGKDVTIPDLANFGDLGDWTLDLTALEDYIAENPPVPGPPPTNG